MAKALFMVKGFVFDVDGTLVNSNSRHVECWQKAFELVGVSVGKDKIKGLIGKGAWQIVDEVLGSDVEKEKKIKVIEEHTRNFEKVIGEVKAFPGLFELFQEIKKRGLLIALATSTKAQFVEDYLKRFKIKSLVEAYTTVEEVTRHKPHPEVLLKAAEKINLKAEEAIAVGDSVWDIQAGRRGGFKVVALLSGGISKEVLMKEKPDWLFKDLIDLKENLELLLKRGNGKKPVFENQ